MEMTFLPLMWIAGGTLVYALVSYQADVFDLAREILNHLWRLRTERRNLVVDRMVTFGALWICQSPEFDLRLKEEKNSSLREGLEFIREGLLDEKALHRIFRVRADYRYGLTMQGVSRLRQLAKVPLAIGLFGALIQLHQSASALEFLITGLIVSFFFVLPIADRVQTCAENIHDEQALLTEGLRLIVARTNPIVMTEELNSYVLKPDRMKRNYLALAPGRKVS